MACQQHVGATRFHTSVHNRSFSGDVRLNYRRYFDAILLQTGKAWAIAPAKTVLVQLLLNTGSQRSFIRQDVARDLNFLVQGTERPSLFTFGQSKRPATFTCERVALTLRSKHGSNENTIEALAIP
ncbi:hypothetical protein HPB51_027230 [Rhipicephalus microplus]|uniref:Uncharacterized protein n=1 Tax=Rhipicephalus microplus TaxID=6941 RepID=A0A9J6D0F6_RHIMP|nr:hypothetical protein HPB51_027230 [Rhipicephalus microplus]